MAVLIIYILLSFKLGVSAFYAYEFTQTLIVFIASSSNHNPYLNRFSSWFQFSKFDIGVLNQYSILKLYSWNYPPSKMTSVQFYCQTTILNYIGFIVLINLIVIFAFIIKWRSLNDNWASRTNKYFAIYINKQSIAWMWVHVILPFVCINIIYEVSDLKQHLIMSLILFSLITALLIALMVKVPEVFTLKFIEEIDTQSPISFTFLTCIKIVVHACMFTTDSKSLHTIWIFAEFVIYLIMGKHFIYFI